MSLQEGCTFIHLQLITNCWDGNQIKSMRAPNWRACRPGSRRRVAPMQWHVRCPAAQQAPNAAPEEEEGRKRVSLGCRKQTALMLAVLGRGDALSINTACSWAGPQESTLTARTSSQQPSRLHRSRPANQGSIKIGQSPCSYRQTTCHVSSASSATLRGLHGALSPFITAHPGPQAAGRHPALPPRLPAVAALAPGRCPPPRCGVH